ncbi:MAG: zinc ribbon domain-containing protein, partial [Candidatus Thermoplasmatota archaeon]|nr:zinc ribbon domain-containing protein [Candidatus Thermoplasmatota archaeon]
DDGAFTEFSKLLGKKPAETLEEMGMEEAILEDARKVEVQPAAPLAVDSFSAEDNLEDLELEETGVRKVIEDSELEAEIISNLVDAEPETSLDEEAIQEALSEMGVEIDDEEEEGRVIAGFDSESEGLEEDDILFRDVEETTGVIWEDDLEPAEPLGRLGVCNSCGAFVREAQDNCEVCGEGISKDVFDSELGEIRDDDDIGGIDAFKSFLGVREDKLSAIPSDLDEESGAVFLCSSCGAFMKEDDEFCGICGTSIDEMDDRPPDYEEVVSQEAEPGLGICKSCGAFVFSQAEKCEVCGSSLAGDGMIIGEDVIIDDEEERDGMVVAGVFQKMLGSSENVPMEVVVEGGEIFLCPECGAFMAGDTFWCPVCKSFVGEGVSEEEAKELITDEIESALQLDMFAGTVPGGEGDSAATTAQGEDEPDVADEFDKMVHMVEEEIEAGLVDEDEAEGPVELEGELDGTDELVELVEELDGDGAPPEEWAEEAEPPVIALEEPEHLGPVVEYEEASRLVEEALAQEFEAAGETQEAEAIMEIESPAAKTKEQGYADAIL